MTEARVLANAPWLTSGPAGRVLALLNGDGEEARVIGGAVRNALLKIPLGDVDIATTALPEEVIRRATAAGVKSVPTGIEHGTVTLVVDRQPFEVTTLREDTETFGRKAKVAFGRDWVRDAERRDFTINGLSVDADGVVHDYVGGLADIAARRVRFIGDASERIAEDYLRILRFFRIHAAYGAGEPDRAGYFACIGGRMGLANLSAERVRMEILKLLVAEGALVAVTAMADGGLLLPIFGGVTYAGPFATMISAEAMLGLEPSPVRRLGALSVAVTEDAKRVAARAWLPARIAEEMLRYSSAELAERLERCRVPFALLRRPDQLLDDAHLIASGQLLDTPLPGGGNAKLPKLPIHSTAFDMGLQRPAPTLGEHTREVLRELGLETDEIDALASRRVIA